MVHGRLACAQKPRRLKPAATIIILLLVPKLPLGNAIGSEAPASLNQGFGEGGEKAGAFSSILVPKQELGNQKIKFFGGTGFSPVPWSHQFSPFKTYNCLFPSKGGRLPTKNVKYFKEMPVQPN